MSRPFSSMQRWPGLIKTSTTIIVTIVHKPPPLRGAPFEKGAIPLTRAFRLSDGTHGVCAFHCELCIVNCAL